MSKDLRELFEAVSDTAPLDIGYHSWDLSWTWARGMLVLVVRGSRVGANESENQAMRARIKLCERELS